MAQPKNLSVVLVRGVFSGNDLFNGVGSVGVCSCIDRILGIFLSRHLQLVWTIIHGAAQLLENSTIPPEYIILSSLLITS